MGPLMVVLTVCDGVTVGCLLRDFTEAVLVVEKMSSHKSKVNDVLDEN